VELSVAAENRIERVVSGQNNRRSGKKGMGLCKADFMCDLKLQLDCYESIARKRLMESVID
jgi:hypothetical protein